MELIVSLHRPAELSPLIDRHIVIPLGLPSTVQGPICIPAVAILVLDNITTVGGIGCQVHCPPPLVSPASDGEA
ncbi:hypothetical protein [Mycobacterium sp. E796]|uniref:hypothetical protein n=1 Tax=Mycobacterium sp. E796 TaxID=1834151 RepID=UPI0012EA8DB7|nr:hypothetical protein [Mycobacterium sp. E796]